MKKLLLILLCLPIIGFGQDDCGNEPKKPISLNKNYNKNSPEYKKYKNDLEIWKNCIAKRKAELGQCISGDCEDGFGTAKYIDGGTLYDGKLNEEGNFTYSYAKYVGQWKNGQFHGNGTYTYSDGENYVGEYMFGKEHGHGTYTWASGDKYVGEHMFGNQHGYGTLTYTDGAKYEGEYKDGKRNGQGTQISADGDKYEGEWKDGKKNGKGTYTFSSGKTAKKHFGEWKDNKANGQGTRTYSNGDKYEGAWKDGKRNGQGTWTEADGTVYKGLWVDNDLPSLDKIYVW